MYKLFLLTILVYSCSQVKKNSATIDLSGDLNEIPDKIVEVKTQKNFPFKDKTKSYGLDGYKGTTLSVVDLNFDEYPDLVIMPSYFDRPLFFEFNPLLKKFKKVDSPFIKDRRVSFIQLYDLNGDRVIDAITGVLNQETEISRSPVKIYYGKVEGGKLRFKDSGIEFPSMATSSVQLIDYNLDGKLDLYFSNWFEKRKGKMSPSLDRLYLNQGKTYLDKTDLLTGESKQNIQKTMFINATPSYGAMACDMDQNGFPDIVSISTNKFQNKLWMNKYKFRDAYRYFENYGVISGVAGDPEGLLNTQGSGRTFSVACSDYNNDGIMDLFLGELGHNFDNEGVDKSSLLTGRSFKFPPKFYRTEYFLDADDPDWHQADRRAIWLDINNDGLLDLIVDNSGYPPHTKLVAFMQMPDHSFVNKAKELGIDIKNPQSSVYLDVNNDGKMDLLTLQSQLRDSSLKTNIVLFENNMNLEGKYSLKLKLESNFENTQALNATVLLKVKTIKGKVETRTRVVNFSYGHLTPQNQGVIHFGVNKGEFLKSITVRWPYAKGIRESRSNLEKHYHLKNKVNTHLNYTVCFNGKYYLGKKSCY